MQTQSVTAPTVRKRRTAREPTERTPEANTHRGDAGTGRLTQNKQKLDALPEQFLLTLLRVLGVWTT